MKKSIFIITTVLFVAAFFLIASDLFAQKIWEERKGMARGQGNVAAGYFLSRREFSGYVTGDAEYFIDNRAGFSGELWYNLPFRSVSQGFWKHHSIYAGMNWHFLKPQKFDPFIGLSPGISMANEKYLDMQSTMQSTDYKIIPDISFTMGCNYYIGSIFHFYLRLKYVYSDFTGINESTRLDELKITAGLGWNLRIVKPKTSMPKS